MKLEEAAATRSARWGAVRTRFQYSLVVVLAIFGIIGRAEAIPRLVFDGVIDFDAATGVIELDGELVSAADTSVAPIPTGAGSSVHLSAQLVDVVVAAPVPGFEVVTGSFSQIDPLEIVDAVGSVLVRADFDELTAGGSLFLPPDLIGFGAMFVPTEGALLNDFLPDATMGPLAKLVSDDIVSASMFDADFQVLFERWDLQPIPEPSTLLLVACGLVGVGVRARFRSRGTA